jgi:hypothetical protein
MMWILPFSIYRFAVGNLAIGLLDLLIVVGIALTASHALLTDRKDSDQGFGTSKDSARIRDTRQGFGTPRRSRIRDTQKIEAARIRDTRQGFGTPRSSRESIGKDSGHPEDRGNP